MSASQKVAHDTRRWLVSPLWWVFWIFLMSAILVTGFLVLNQVRDYQHIHGQLEELRVQQEELLSEFTRLQIERGSQASFERVVDVATEEMNMEFPATAVTVTAGDDQ